MLGDEFFFGADGEWLGLALGGDVEALPAGWLMPAVGDVAGVAFFFDGVVHGQGEVGFVVDAVGDGGDGPAGDEFADEDDAASPFVVGGLVADVEAEVDFFKVGVEGDGDAE